MIERFCMRINEYVEHRFSKTNITDKVISLELGILKCSLHKVFFQFDREAHGVALPSILLKISDIINKHFIKILKRLISLSEVHSVPAEVVALLK